VRRDHLAPGLEAAGHPALDGLADRLALLAPRLFVEAQAQQFHLHLVHFVGLGGRDGGQQALGGIQGAVSVIAGEGLLVGPLIAPGADLRHQTTLGKAEGLAENLVPGLRHQLEQGRAVPLLDALVGQHRVLDKAPHLGHGQGISGNGRPDLPVNKGPETRLQQLQRLADTFVVGNGHAICYP
jgi:hypothetical protein